MADSTKTLLIGPNWVGDTVMAVPVVEALAAAGREVHVLARPHLHPLLGLVPEVRAAVEKSPSDRETIERLRAAGFEEAVILPNSFRSAWLPFRAAIPSRWGYRGQWRSPLLTGARRHPPRRGRHHVEDYAELLAAMGVEPPASWTPALLLPEQIRRRGAEVLARAGVRAGRERVIGLFPGAEFGPSKRWPRDRFAELSRTLRRDRGTFRQVLVAGPKEVWLAVRIHETSGRVLPVLGPDLDLAELAGLLSHLDLLITNDSGPMHLAAAVGVPCVAFFGPTNPARTHPRGAGHRVLYSDRWCAPCYRKRCPLLHHRCMKELTVESALAAAIEILGAPARSGA